MRYTVYAAIGTLLLLSACSTFVGAHGEGTGFEQLPTESAGRPEEPPSICYDCHGFPAGQVQVDELDIPGGKLANRSAYFDFDKYAVREEGKAVVETHAAYLTKNQRTILIQGNTDERGGSEYNLALGQKRAEAVRKSLAALGIPDDRMEAISLGKEKPKAEGHNEEAWAQNRRADIVYKAN